MKIAKHINVIITDHALERFLIRTGIMEEETFHHIKRCEADGDRRAKRRFKHEKRKLEERIRESILVRFYNDGCELRRDTRYSKRTRCQYVLARKGNEVTLITSYLQGRSDDFWKIQPQGDKNNA